MTDAAFSFPTLDDIREAAAVLARHLVQTRLLRSDALDEITGGTVFLKPEVLQRTGSFKFRGAMNRISRLPESDRRRGIVAFSSGNHALAVAAAASHFKIAATIFMPSDAPEIKMRKTRELGAEIIEYDRDTADRDALYKSHIAEHGGTLVHPFEDFDVIAGQGTIGLEIVEEAGPGIAVDTVIVNASGGGVGSGIGIAVKGLSPSTEIVLAEPEGFERFANSLKAGHVVENSRKSGTICDALLAAKPGALTFKIARTLGFGTASVSDAEVCRAMAFAFGELKLVVEPGGAAALAAVLAGKIDLRGKTAVVVLSGGNVDAALFSGCIRHGYH